MSPSPPPSAAKRGRGNSGTESHHRCSSPQFADSLDFSSAFNTIIPNKLALKLREEGLPASLCHWIRDFLTNRPQVVRIGDMTLSSLVLNNGPPQGCVLSPLHPAYTQLHCHPPHQLSREVRGRHYSSGSHLGRQRDPLQRGDPAPHSVVFSQQPGAEHREDQGGHCEKWWSVWTTSSFWASTSHLTSLGPQTPPTW